MAATLVRRMFIVPPVDSDLIEVDRNAEINPDLAHGIAQVGEGAFRILSRVADDNVARPPQDHLVKGKVLEVAAIGEVDVWIAGIGQTECFRDDRAHADVWVGELEGLISGRSWIPKPGAESHV